MNRLWRNWTVHNIVAHPLSELLKVYSLTDVTALMALEPKIELIPNIIVCSPHTKFYQDTP